MGEISEALRRAREAPVRADAPLAPASRLEPAVLFPSPTSTAPVTVAIPTSEEAAWRARAVLVHPTGEIAESYRHFAIRMQRMLRERNARSLLVTSSTGSEGKTTTACNLALALASISAGQRFALLELDLRRPSAAKQLGVEEHCGVEQVLSGEASLSDVREGTQLAELDLYLARGPADAPLAAVSSKQVGVTIRELARQYDLVVIDSPPVLPVPDIPLLVAHVDAILLVARAGLSRLEAVRDAVGSLDNQKLLGLFLNERRTPRHKRYATSYGYGTPPAEASEHGAD